MKQGELCRPQPLPSSPSIYYSRALERDILRRGRPELVSGGGDAAAAAAAMTDPMDRSTQLGICRFVTLPYIWRFIFLFKECQIKRLFLQLVDRMVLLFSPAGNLTPSSWNRRTRWNT
ncbi:hypothetical protein GUJ93_ZPchr0006g41991 [Zizania palustris]|uniref:Uncharacterized protein n=1 Tax=Zizania palustris TaxID=103762 RepID=A0A8J5STQ6_ZIZPA|nr:hypothetical protein GUJ93_ZPchr0006g41991 [Zizania palustris]